MAETLEPKKKRKETRPRRYHRFSKKKISVRLSASQGLMSRTFRKTQTINPREKKVSPKRINYFLRYSINIQKSQYNQN